MGKRVKTWTQRWLPSRKALRPGAALLVTALGMAFCAASALGSDEKLPPVAARSLTGHRGPVNAVDFAGDNKLLASGGADRSVRLWDAATGKEQQTLKGARGAVLAVAFNPRFRLLAAAGTDQVIVWETRQGRPVGPLRGHTGDVLAVAFAPDGRTLASGGADRTVRLWDLKTGKEKAILKGHLGQVNALAFAQDGKTLATASDDKTVKLWEPASGKERATLKGHTSAVLALAFSPSGKTLATGGLDKMVRLWDATTGKLLATLEGHKGGVYAIAFGPDGRTLVSGGSDRAVWLWDGFHKKARDVYEGYDDTIAALAISPDNRLLAIGTLGGSLLFRPIEPLPVVTERDYKDLLAAMDRGRALEKQDKWKEAVEHYEKTIPLASRLRGPRSEVTAVLVDALGTASWKTGQLSKAIAAYERGLVTWETLPGKEHDLVLSLSLLGNAYKETGHFDKGALLVERALKIREQKLGGDDPKVAQLEYNLASFYLTMARYAEAEKLLERSLKTQQSKLGADDPHTAKSLNGLAFLYAAVGRPARAESYYVRSLKVLEERLGPKAEDVGRVANNMGLFYAGLGQLAKAEPLLERSVQIMEGHYGRGHPATANSLNSLGYLYLAGQQYAKAELLFRRSLRILEAQYGSDHPEVMVGQSNLANLYLNLGEYSKAGPLLERTLKIAEARFGADHPVVAVTLNNLAICFARTGEYLRAQPFVDRSLKIADARLGPHHPGTALFLMARVGLDGALGRWTEAATAADRARHILRGHITRTLPILSEREQLTFLKTQDADGLHLALSLAWWRPKDEALAAQSAGWALNGKAVAQQALAERTLLARTSGDPKRGKLLEHLLQVRRQLATLTLSSAGREDSTGLRQRLDRLAEQEQTLAKQLGRLEGRPVADDPWVGLEQVRKALPVDAVLIEIVKLPIWDFREKNPQKAWKAPRYLAWVIPAADKGVVRIIDLGEGDKLEMAVRKARRAMQNPPTALVAEGKDEETALTDLTRLSLRPLLAAGIGSAQRWIISPDAALWLVPWGALPLENGRYALETYKISYVISGRDLVEPGYAGQAGAPVVFADPDYDLGADELAAEARRVLKGHSRGKPRLAQRSSGLGDVRWDRLPGTAAEAKAITPKLKAWAGATPVVYLGKEALEPVFKNVVRPGALVLSTHGFFLENQEGTLLPLAAPVPKRSLEVVDVEPPPPLLVKVVGGKEAKPLENPLLRCGLVLAGANQRQKVTAESGDDGILTGLEIVGTDLRGTQLVVLSACETGLGQVRNGEGVAGLRQAFQLAGARAVVATLWKIPDRETAQLMGGFFEELARGRDKADALREAQLAFIKKRRAEKKSAHPFYWAAFTFTGAWR